MGGCDLLENMYLGGSNNNRMLGIYRDMAVVICLKICTFVVATTTRKRNHPYTRSCDLLENMYLCGSNNNILTATSRA